MNRSKANKLRRKKNKRRAVMSTKLSRDFSFYYTRQENYRITCWRAFNKLLAKDAGQGHLLDTLGDLPPPPQEVLSSFIQLGKRNMLIRGLDNLAEYVIDLKSNPELAS